MSDLIFETEKTVRISCDLARDILDYTENPRSLRFQADSQFTDMVNRMRTTGQWQVGVEGESDLPVTLITDGEGVTVVRGADRLSVWVRVGAPLIARVCVRNVLSKRDKFILRVALSYAMSNLDGIFKTMAADEFDPYEAGKDYPMIVLETCGEKGDVIEREEIIALSRELQIPVTETIHWTELNITTGEQCDSYLKLGDAVSTRDPIFSTLELEEDGSIRVWDWLVFAPGEEPNADTPYAPVDWTGFADAIKPLQFDEAVINALEKHYKFSFNPTYISHGFSDPHGNVVFLKTHEEVGSFWNLLTHITVQDVEYAIISSWQLIFLSKIQNQSDELNSANISS